MKKRLKTAHENFDNSRLSDQQFFNKNQRQPVDLTFHPYNNDLLVADSHGVSVWEWEKGQRKFYLHNNNPQSTSISSIQLINQQEQPLLTVGSDDGCIRIWKDCCGESIIKPSLVTAWQALPDMTTPPRKAGLVAQWDPSALHMHAGGDSKQVLTWDTVTERKVEQFQTGTDSSLTCMTLGHGLLSAGFSDGTIRLFDTRGRQSTFNHHAVHVHNAWVLTTAFLGGVNLLLSACEQGEVKLWDFRMMSNEPYGVIRSAKSGGIRQLAVHSTLPILACSTVGSVNFHNLNGEELGSVRYYDGFLGQRLGLVSCMGFHPLLANLAVGTADSFLTVYSGEVKG